MSPVDSARPSQPSPAAQRPSAPPPPPPSSPSSSASKPASNPSSTGSPRSNPYTDSYNPYRSGSSGSNPYTETRKPAESRKPAAADNPYLDSSSRYRDAYNPYTPRANPYDPSSRALSPEELRGPVEKRDGRVSSVRYPDGGRLGASYDSKGQLDGLGMKDQSGRSLGDLKRDSSGWYNTSSGQRVPGSYSLQDNGTLNYKGSDYEIQLRQNGSRQTAYPGSGAQVQQDDRGRINSAGMGNTRARFDYHPEDHADPRMRGALKEVRYNGLDGKERRLSPTDGGPRWDDRGMFSIAGKEADGTNRMLQMDFMRGVTGDSWNRGGDGGNRIRQKDGSQNVSEYSSRTLGNNGERRSNVYRELDRGGKETQRVARTFDRHWDDRGNINREKFTQETSSNGGRPTVEVTDRGRTGPGQWREELTVNGKQRYHTDPRPEGLPDTANDGALVGRNGRVYEPNVPLNRAPAVTPDNGKKPGETVLFVNGINNSREDIAGSMQALANKGNFRVVGVLNASKGAVMDVFQSAGDKWGISGNPATATVRDQVLRELREGRDVHLFAHSQGGIITSGALNEVKDRLTSAHGEKKATEMMNRIKVETFGGAAWRYPDGPKYVHYAHTADLVSGPLGQGWTWFPFRSAGEGAKHVNIPYREQGFAHNFGSTYLPYLRPFNEVYQGK